MACALAAKARATKGRCILPKIRVSSPDQEVINLPSFADYGLRVCRLLVCRLRVAGLPITGCGFACDSDFITVGCG
jgi:hypothetical protein